MKAFRSNKQPLEKDFLIGIFCLFGLFLLMILFVLIGIKGYISDSEIWAVTLSKNLTQEWFHPWVYTRPLFYLFVGFFVALGKNAATIFILAKIASTINGVLICFFTYKLSKAILSSEKTNLNYLPIFTVVLLLANTSFLNQGSRIRSDLLATSLLLYALISTLKNYGQLSLKSKLLWISPLLATPKAIFQISSFLILDVPKKYKLYLIDFLVIFTIGTFLFYPQLVEYIVSAFKTAFFESEHNFIVRWMYLKRMVGLNWIFVGFLICRFFIFPMRLYLNCFESPQSRKMHETIAKVTLIFAIVFTLTPEKVPFLLAAYLPVFTIYAALLLNDIEQLIKIVVPQKRNLFYQKAIRTSFILLTFSLSCSAIWQAKDILQNDNSNAQFHAVTSLEEYLDKYPNATHFDIIGILPQRTEFRIFAGPNDSKLNKFASNWFQKNPTDLIFLTNKFHLLGDEFFTFFYQNYASLGGGVFAKWHFLNKEQQSSKTLELEFEKISKKVGKKHSGAITALIVKIPLHAQIYTDSIKELLKMKVENPSLYVIGISPFAPVPTDIGLLYNLFTFDVDY